MRDDWGITWSLGLTAWALVEMGFGLSLGCLLGVLHLGVFSRRKLNQGPPSGLCLHASESKALATDGQVGLAQEKAQWTRLVNSKAKGPYCPGLPALGRLLAATGQNMLNMDISLWRNTHPGFQLTEVSVHAWAHKGKVPFH